MKLAPTAALLAGVALLPATASAQDAVADPIVGVWQLVTPEGAVVTQSQFTSQIIFSSDGTMAVQSMAPDPEATSPYMRSGYEAYYGTYAIDETAGTVTFSVESAIARDLIGQDLERTYEVADDRLTLEPTSPDESWSVTYARRGDTLD